MDHEGGHWNLLPNRRGNEWATNALACVWFAVTAAGYRRTHFPHHAKPAFFVDGDPDTDFLDVSSRRDLWHAVLRDLLGITVIRQFLRFERQPEAAGASRWPFVAAAGVQLVLIAALFRAGRLDAWLLYYGTLATFYPLLNRLRVYGQHVEIGVDGTSRFSGSPTSRTIDGGPLDRILHTSPRLLYHHEHHRYPQLPYRALAARCERGDDVNRYAESRWDVLRRIYRGLP